MSNAKLMALASICLTLPVFPDLPRAYGKGSNSNLIQWVNDCEAGARVSAGSPAARRRGPARSSSAPRGAKYPSTMASVTSSQALGLPAWRAVPVDQEGSHAFVEILAFEEAAHQPVVVDQRGAQIPARAPSASAGSVTLSDSGERCISSARTPSAQVAAAPVSRAEPGQDGLDAVGREAARNGRRAPRRAHPGPAPRAACRAPDRPDRHRRPPPGSRRTGGRGCNASPARADRRRPARPSARSAPGTCRSRPGIRASTWLTPSSGNRPMPVSGMANR